MNVKDFFFRDSDSLPPYLRMHRPPSEPPSEDEPVVTLDKHADDPPADVTPSSRSDLGLSKAQVDEVVKAMLVVVHKMGCPVHLHPLDVVNDAFVVALSEPISKRPSIADWERFVAWFCTCAIHAALTNRKSKHRRLLGQGHEEEQIGAYLPVAGHAETVDAHVDLQRVLSVLEPDDLKLLNDVFFEGKTIQDLKLKKNEPWSTVKSRYQRALDLLYAALQALIAALILLFPKNVRAEGLRWAQRLSRLVPHATQTACAMTVTVACGVIIPASSLAIIEHNEVPGTTLAAFPRPTFAPAMVPAGPPIFTKVEPEKPNVIDEAENQWSAADMKATTFVRYLQSTMLPFAFLVTPALTQVACAGTEHHTPPPQEPDDYHEGSYDPYDSMCMNAHRMGSECPSKADWYKSMGRCPDGTKGCQ